LDRVEVEEYERTSDEEDSEEEEGSLEESVVLEVTDCWLEEDGSL
jgi:hypothetical protein